MEQAEAAAAAQARLERKGLTIPPRPRGSLPELPSDRTELADRELMNLVGEITAWADYLSGQLSLAEIDERMADRLQSEAEAVVMIRIAPANPREGTMTVAKARRQLDPLVKERTAAHDTAYAYRKLMQVLYTNVDRDSALVSRELTRRTAGADAKVRRAERWRP